MTGSEMSAHGASGVTSSRGEVEPPELRVRALFLSPSCCGCGLGKQVYVAGNGRVGAGKNWWTRGLVQNLKHVVWCRTGNTWFGAEPETRGLVQKRKHVVWCRTGNTWFGAIPEEAQRCWIRSRTEVLLWVESVAFNTFIRSFSS